MALLYLGVIVFFGVHLLPSLPLKGMVIDRFGEATFKIGFSLISLTGFLLLIFGFRAAEFISIWTPLPYGRELAIWTMPFVSILLVAANAPNNIGRWLRHPMLVGITIWGATHLAANGDLASGIIFASFASFSVINILLVETQGRFKQKPAVPVWWDAIVIVAGLALYAALFFFHGHFTGMPLV